MSSGDLPSATLSMIQQGQDPKELVLQHCKPNCLHWEQKLKRCEAKLRELVNADPEMSCMYPLRDWVTCVEACVQPQIISQLVGAQKGRIW
ncbi:ubiquinol-cytochrome C reductase hinge protein (macronuclear) [Tetrahymena thermophila SB210]|uniref:Ubiquinol-cytochrome C reductase hinge protein n=1 Tax=Tetrahymena thermophila (strain SB210) TaxID=312017 RepID=Q22AX2_TETTS|nr:ubiquinol-cytochrome C reductase hinge protein [Tetrahymena thermophila SB210]7TGH_3F Chain 3F, Ubiquinol-cytochrome C reductase hinge protein [Tetrahymena thermophila]7TGH_3f Chain 3f, Ubiquinol-cytochrome C reductase hinge protein [Tetrahymena thermophila]8GYM_QF Chain QF, Ubiquinol-cytochrome C reductase hinge protein [Tetrahymena thermophila SB210]8GYM_Qf Chain Qf, Ubiquinol-cytochrome C reductase hinge protein [Tetrahymena thermophila SB210]8GYM_qF Chain qF, Ubiquinol-cytochrome C redu|eukprot:XP_001030105.3 ubiquinol-cytochrome C reductase hinge protein [Tetrahymena thermophila SB210]